MSPQRKRARSSSEEGARGPHTLSGTGSVAAGLAQIALAERSMSALVALRSGAPFEKAGLRIGVNLHVTKETAVLVKTLVALGARVCVAGCNAFSTQDDVAAALASLDGVEVHAVRGCSTAAFYAALDRVVAFGPEVVVDDGCDLTVRLHAAPRGVAGVLGGCEQTTSGVIRAVNMHKAGSLKMPVVATNNNDTKRLLDNYYGTGQSVMDGIVRATALFVAAKTVVVVGYGPCGKGVALRAACLGAQVVVTEVDPFRALQATYDGFRVMPMAAAAPLADVVVTLTGNKHVVSRDHMRAMKAGAVLCNGGQFVHEIDVDWLKATATAAETVRPNMVRYALPGGADLVLLGDGNLVNLSCAEGHPSEVMATSFLGQLLAVKHIVASAKDLKPGVHALPKALDQEIAALQLEALGVEMDAMTPEQVAYAAEWEEGY